MADPPQATLSVRTTPEGVELAFTGKLTAEAIGHIWTEVGRAARAAHGRALRADLREVTHCDTAGAALLLAAETNAGGPIAIEGGPDSVVPLLERLRNIPPPEPVPARPRRGPATILADGVQAAVAGIAFLGEIAMAVVRLPARHRMLRWSDLVRFADAAGVRAVPLVVMLGFLIGVILAFQSAIPLQRFGAEIFVANLVAVGLMRELGPLLTSVILAGRTGSAFAAEIGTMKVNEELAAITTLGLDGMTMLVLPRIMAALLVMPALILLLDLSGLVGMAVVMGSLGYPPAAVAAQVVQSTQIGDMVGGLAKGLGFGAAIAAIGCRAGMNAGIGPRAVGEASTSAVVGGIVAMVFLDGLFAVIFYIQGW
jgi:phospholipid/cholesterol/gamma-HCH transport system permease protein